MKNCLKLLLLLCLAAVVSTSCNKPDAEPPKTTAVNVNASYKMPATTPLTQAERDIVDAIFTEYDSNRP